MDTTLNIVKLTGVHAGRTMLVQEPRVEVRADGTTVIVVEPVQVALELRPAESAPTGTRVKASFEAPLNGVPLKLPLAGATVGLPGLSVEFRLESN